MNSRIAVAVVVTALCTNVNAAETNETIRLAEVVVQGDGVPTTLLPPVEGARVLEGKKASQAILADQPPVVNNNHRQAVAQLPGLLIAEAAVPTHLNQNYRGVGDPHESEYVLTLKDGIPLSSDWLGYSTVYFAPPWESVERIEFTRGGSGLLYGPQPGPVVNYVTDQPPANKEIELNTLQIGGSYNLYTSYSSVGGTVGSVGYLAGYSHTQSDGSRNNADYQIDSGTAKLVLHAAADEMWWLNFDGGSKEVGEAGRLTRAQYQTDPTQTTTPHNRVWVDRYVPTLGYQRNLSADALIIVNAWGGYQDRFSRRQSNALTNNLDRQEFNFGGLDARLRFNWDAWQEQHTLTAGIVGYGSDSPRTRERGTPLAATSGQAVFDVQRSTAYGALFAENLFRFGKLSIVPAGRLDFASLSVDEKYNTGVTRPLIDTSELNVVPLGGIGVAYDLPRSSQIYANFSMGYRPIEYDDLVNPTSNTQLAPGDLAPSITYTYEIGLRGTPFTWWQYDTSLFFIDYDDYIETQALGGGNVERSNSGAAQYMGWEAATELNLVGWLDSVRGTSYAQRYGSVTLFGSVSLLSAEFVAGPNDGNRPAYAPDYVVKSGATYRFRDRVNLSLTGQMVSDMNWQDNNTAGTVGQTKIPAYTVWDLSTECALYKQTLFVVGGVNNLFDEDYYSRIRGDGIEPLDGRNYYVGLKITFP